jgi:hypothetical protein
MNSVFTNLKIENPRINIIIPIVVAKIYD